jgi:hypothetical protein
MKYLKQFLILFVSIIVLNVWLLRFNKATIYRGGDASNMIEEFLVYGIDKPFFVLSRSNKNSCSSGSFARFFLQKVCYSLRIHNNGAYDWCGGNAL